jgi:alkanesulfonate monooxygenase SsuD/methylene tetrahydromethanopterin reductase-like flavin-dependent oxidoreductase (luciferase family)
MLAAIAASTSRIKLGPLVAATAFHAPPMLAKLAATVDEISGGRLILGLGAGWNETEFAAFGFPYDHRVSRFEEAFTIIRTLLREGYIDFSGTYYEIRDCTLVPRGPRPEGPPLMLGSIGERMLKFAAPHIDAWNAWHDWFGNTPEGLAELNATVDDAVRAAGRDPSEVARTATVLVQMTGGTGRLSGGEFARPTPPLKGAPEEIAQGLRAYAAIGMSHVQLVLDPITVDAIEELAPALELLDRD